MLKSMMFLAGAMLAFGGPLLAADGDDVTPQIRRTAVDETVDGVDRPCPPVKVVIPALPASSTSAPIPVPFTGSQVNRGESGGDAPSQEVQPGADVASAPPASVVAQPPKETVVDKASYEGKDVGGKVVWCIDRSGSMGIQDAGLGAVEDHNGNTIHSPTRLQVVKAEVTRAIKAMTDTDQYAIVFYGGYPQTSADARLITADDNGKRIGLNRLRTAHSGYNTPTKLGLNLALTNYGTDLDTIFFLSDGLPTMGPGPTEIINWFPGAFAPHQANGCEFHVTHIGSNKESLAFMQNLANSVGGTFSKR